MASAFSSPLLIRPDGSVVTLRNVDLSGKGQASYDEAWLQNHLYEHPQTLPSAEIDPAFAGLIPLCMEMDTPSGTIDIVYATPTGRIALVEAKLWRNPEARRKVIGQILDYATQIASWDYSRLENAVRQARRRSNPEEPFAGLAAWVAARAGNDKLPEHAFIDAVSKTLSRGDLLLLIAGDGIREGAGAIAQFLDRNGALHFTFGLIECAIYAAPDGSRFVQPRLLAQSTNIVRTFVHLKGERLAEEVTEPTDEQLGTAEIDPDLAASRKAYEEYWAEFLAKLRVEDYQPVSKPAKSTNQYFSMPKGSNGWIGAYLAQTRGCAGVYLTFNEARVAKSFFLYSRKVKTRSTLHSASRPSGQRLRTACGA